MCSRYAHITQEYKCCYLVHVNVGMSHGAPGADIAATMVEELAPHIGTGLDYTR